MGSTRVMEITSVVLWEACVARLYSAVRTFAYEAMLGLRVEGPEVRGNASWSSGVTIRPAATRKNPICLLEEPFHST